MTWYLTILQYRYLKENPNFEVKIWFFRYQKFNFCTICIHKLHVTSRLVQQETRTNQMTVFQVTPHQCRIHRPSDQVEKCWEHYGCDGPAQVEVGWHGFHQRNMWKGKLHSSWLSLMFPLHFFIQFFFSACAIAFPILCTRSWLACVPRYKPSGPTFFKKNHTFPWNAFMHHIHPATPTEDLAFIGNEKNNETKQEPLSLPHVAPKLITSLVKLHSEITYHMINVLKLKKSMWSNVI